MTISRTYLGFILRGCSKIVTRYALPAKLCLILLLLKCVFFFFLYDPKRFNGININGLNILNALINKSIVKVFIFRLVPHCHDHLEDVSIIHFTGVFQNFNGGYALPSKFLLTLTSYDP